MAKQVSQNNFEQEVLQSAQPVLVDFWADWCGPCKMLAPVLEQVSAELEGKAVVAKLNVDESPDLAQKYGVMSIPTVILFRDGAEVTRSVGLVPKDRLVAML